jgi:hypothetical protein
LTCTAANANIPAPWRNVRFFHKVALNISVLAELLTFFGTNKRWWLLPILITLFLFGALIIVGQSSGLAPFIYTLF